MGYFGVYTTMCRNFYIFNLTDHLLLKRHIAVLSLAPSSLSVPPGALHSAAIGELHSTNSLPVICANTPYSHFSLLPLDPRRLFRVGFPFTSL